MFHYLVGGFTFPRDLQIRTTLLNLKHQFCKFVSFEGYKFGSHERLLPEEACIFTYSPKGPPQGSRGTLALRNGRAGRPAEGSHLGAACSWDLWALLAYPGTLFYGRWRPPEPPVCLFLLSKEAPPRTGSHQALRRDRLLCSQYVFYIDVTAAVIEARH